MLEHFLSSRTRVKLLQTFLLNPEGSFFMRELSRKLGEHTNSVRRELTNLEEVGLLKSAGKDQKRYYQVNTEFVLYAELRALIFKAQVMTEHNLLRELGRMGRVQYAVLTGYFSNLPEAQTDLLIVGSVNRRKLRALMRRFQQHFDRELRYTVMSRKEFDYRNDLTDRFLYHILENPHLAVINKLKEKPKV